MTVTAEGLTDANGDGLYTLGGCAPQTLASPRPLMFNIAGVWGMQSPKVLGPFSALAVAPFDLLRARRVAQVGHFEKLPAS